MKTAIVSFDHPYDSRCTTICNTKITVEELFYGGTGYYNISYKHWFVDKMETLCSLRMGIASYLSNCHTLCMRRPTRQADQWCYCCPEPSRRGSREDALMKDNEISRLIAKAARYRRTIMHDLAKKWD